MIEENIRIKKSLMYKIISLGFSVYVDEWDDFVITILVCQDCNHFWNKSRTECVYCGTENYHVYKCNRCGKMYSLTKSNKKECSTEGCNGKLVKSCINPECISNTNRRMRAYLDGLGGVFNIKQSASTLNEMHCKECGSFTSTLKAIKTKMVEQINDELEKDINVLYIVRNGVDDISAYYNGVIYEHLPIESILIKVFNLSEDSLFNELGD